MKLMQHPFLHRRSDRNPISRIPRLRSQPANNSPRLLFLFSQIFPCIPICGFEWYALDSFNVCLGNGNTGAVGKLWIKALLDQMCYDVL